MELVQKQGKSMFYAQPSPLQNKNNNAYNTRVLRGKLSRIFLATGALLEKYQTLVASHKLKPDKQQLACVQQLNHLCDQLSDYNTHVQRFQAVSLQYMVCWAGESSAVHKLSHSMPDLM